jgi:hypothetical protein
MTVIALPSGNKIDFGNASKEEIQRNLLLLKEEKPSLFQASRKTPQEDVEVNEEIVKEDVEKPKVDYVTGVESNVLRYAFGRADNPREQKKELLALGIPEEGISQDSKGEFILNLERIPEDVKKKYGLKSKEGFSHVAVDESSITGEDVIEFFAAAGTPIATGTAAAIAAGSAGMGAIPAALLVGGATGLSYILDEAVDYARGTRDQTIGEDAKNFFFEVLLGAGGEVGGRLLSGLFGRIIKGPGGPEANQAREQAREIIAGKIDPVTGQRVRGAPTLRAANLAPLMGRTQAFFEGVFPSRSVATRNAKYLQTSYLKLLREIKPGNISEEQAKKMADGVYDSLEKDIDRMYSGPEALVKKAENDLTNTIDTEINSLKTKFGQGPKFGPESSGERLQIAKAQFDEVKDMIYSRADEAVSHKKIIPTKKLKRVLNNMENDPVYGSEIANSRLGQIIKTLEDEGATASTMGSIRTALGDASYDPLLIGTPNTVILGNLKRSVDQSFIDAEATLLADAAPRIWAMDNFGVPRFAAKGKGGKFISKKEAEDEIALFRSKKEALELLRRAGDLYHFGIKKIDTYLANTVIQGVKKSDSILKEPAKVLDVMVQPGQGQLLKDFLNAVRPIPQRGVLGSKGLPEPKRPVHWSEMVPNEKISIKETVGGPSEIISLRELVVRNSTEAGRTDDSLVRYYKRKFNESQNFANKIDEARAAGVSYKDATRQILARDWLETTINNPVIQDINGKWDPIKLAQQIEALDVGTDAMRKEGLTTARVLFGKDFDDVNKIIRDFKKISVDQEQASDLLKMPVSQARKAVSDAVEEQERVGKIKWLSNLREAVNENDTDRISSLVTKSTERAREVKKAFSEIDPKTGKVVESSAMENVKDALMVKALGIVGDPADIITTRKTMFGREVLERKVSKEFVEKVKSGSIHNQLFKAMEDMGYEQLEIIFGKETLNKFRHLARESEAVSMKPIQGLGGLETANIARNMGVAKLMSNFMEVVGAISGMTLMGRILRSKPYLDLLTRPTNDIETARNLEKILTLGWSTVLRTMSQTGADQGPITPSEEEIDNFVTRINTGTARQKSTATEKPPVDYGTYRPSNLLTAEDLNASAALRQREMNKLLYGTP